MSKETAEHDADPSRERRLSLIDRFYRGGRLTAAEMSELTALYKENTARVWEASAAKEEVEA